MVGTPLAVRAFTQSSLLRILASATLHLSVKAESEITASPIARFWAFSEMGF